MHTRFPPLPKPQTKLTHDWKEPIARFRLPHYVTSITPFQYCNLHGAFQGPTVAIPHVHAEL